MRLESDVLYLHNKVVELERALRSCAYGLQAIVRACDDSPGGFQDHIDRQRDIRDAKKALNDLKSYGFLDE